MIKLSFILLLKYLGITDVIYSIPVFVSSLYERHFIDRIHGPEKGGLLKGHSHRKNLANSIKSLGRNHT